MHSITSADADRFAAIRVALGQLGAYAVPLAVRDGARYDWEDGEPRLLRDEVPGWLLRLPQQAKESRR